MPKDQNDVPTAVAVVYPDATQPAPLSRSVAPPSKLSVPDFHERYAPQQSLGEGGMGVVRSCADHRIGREVALKTLRASAGGEDFASRFLREAYVQGQLEHPAIVPVYEVGRDPQGELFFTMKRVRGLTLSQILEELRSDAPGAAARHTRHKLLTAFAAACHAIHFAHTRGVVHRDLKPSNVMIGNFGEVYVLDWGIAKVLGWNEETRVGHAPPGSVDSGVRTEAGSTLGTVGYMAPEQAMGVADLDGRADVYSLGTVLFELLTLQRLHEGESSAAVLARTLSGVDARPSARVPDAGIAPELDDIVLKATATERDDRFASVNELNEALERYLAGDRDTRLRQELALQHTRAASSEAARALQPGPQSLEARQSALRSVGRALALDPSNLQASRTFVELLVHPPDELPPDAAARELSEKLQSRRAGMGRGAMLYASWILLSPFFVFMGARLSQVAALAGVLSLAALTAFLRSRATSNDHAVDPIEATVGALAVSALAAVFGPYMLMPGILTSWAMFHTVLPPDTRRANLVVALGCLALVLPLALEWLGVVPPSYAFENGAMIILPRFVRFTPLVAHAMLLGANLAYVVLACGVSRAIRNEQRRTEVRLQTQSWQLEQMTPLLWERVPRSGG